MVFACLGVTSSYSNRFLARNFNDTKYSLANSNFEWFLALVWNHHFSNLPVPITSRSIAQRRFQVETSGHSRREEEQEAKYLGGERERHLTSDKYTPLTLYEASPLHCCTPFAGDLTLLIQACLSNDCAAGINICVKTDNDGEIDFGPGSLAKTAAAPPTQHGQYYDIDDPRYLLLKNQLWTCKLGNGEGLYAVYKINNARLATGQDRATVVNKVFDRMSGKGKPLKEVRDIRYVDYDLDFDRQVDGQHTDEIAQRF